MERILAYLEHRAQKNRIAAAILMGRFSYKCDSIPFSDTLRPGSSFSGAVCATHRLWLFLPGPFRPGCQSSYLNDTTYIRKQAVFRKRNIMDVCLPMSLYYAIENHYFLSGIWQILRIFACRTYLDMISETIGFMFLIPT